MDSGSNDKDKPKEGQSGGFQFNAPVSAGSQMFIDARNANNLNISQGLSLDALKELDKLFQPLKEQIKTAPPDKHQQAEEQVQELHSELSKGQSANVDRLNKIIDGLMEMVPGALSTIVSMFANPILGALVGPATKLVLDRINK